MIRSEDAHGASDAGSSGSRVLAAIGLASGLQRRVLRQARRPARRAPTSAPTSTPPTTAPTLNELPRELRQFRRTAQSAQKTTSTSPAIVSWSPAPSTPSTPSKIVTDMPVALSATGRAFSAAARRSPTRPAAESPLRRLRRDPERRADLRPGEAMLAPRVAHELGTEVAGLLLDTSHQERPSDRTLHAATTAGDECPKRLAHGSSLLNGQSIDLHPVPPGPHQPDRGCRTSPTPSADANSSHRVPTGYREPIDDRRRTCVDPRSRTLRRTSALKVCAAPIREHRSVTRYGVPLD